MITPRRRLAVAIVVFATIVTCHRHSYYEAPKLEGVSFEAYSTFRGPALDTVGIWLSMVATEKAPPTIDIDGCPPSAQFKLVSGKRGESHKWDYVAMEESKARKAGMMFGCAGMLLRGPIGPEMRQSRLTFAVAVKDVLGDSLPSGLYKITLFSMILGAQPIPAGFLNLRADR